MSLLLGTNYDHFDICGRADGNTVRHMLQDTEGRALMAPTEASSTASAALAAGSYFILGGVLYRATEAIAAGAAIVTSGSGQNAEAVTVGGELQALTNAIQPARYESIAEVAAIVRNNDVARNQRLFPIGDQIIVPWKDMDDENHNTDETAYQVAWDIVHHELVELENGDKVPGMFLQMHKCSPYGIPFGAPQAFYNCPNGLPAGTYSFKLSAAYGSIAANSILEFTLTQAVPANGRIRMDTGRSVTTWAAVGDSPIETVTASIVQSASGANLGTTGAGGLNTVGRMQYGSNRWSTSTLRQYLNKSGANWFAAQGAFDVPPEQVVKKGFMTGFGADFLAALKPVKVTTALNTVEGFAEESEDTFDTFFLPSLQQMNVTPDAPDVEGRYFEYWRARMGLDGYTGMGSENAQDAFKIPSLSSNSAQALRLRSAYRIYSNYTRAVNAAGYIEVSYSYGNRRFTPVCVIC